MAVGGYADPTKATHVAITPTVIIALRYPVSAEWTAGLSAWFAGTRTPNTTPLGERVGNSASPSAMVAVVAATSEAKTIKFTSIASFQ